MKIAIASSGLGHVARGIETWALDLALALSRYAGVSAPDIEVILFAGAPVRLSAADQLQVEIVPCLKRGGRAARLLTRLMPGFTWRWGLKATYGWEQLSFWLALRRRLRRYGCDILHVQDPMLADLCRRARARGSLITKEILAHGTEESPDFLQKFEFVQHLAPWHQASTESTGSTGADRIDGESRNNPGDRRESRDGR